MSSNFNILFNFFFLSKHGHIYGSTPTGGALAATEAGSYVNKASQAIQSPRTVPFFLLVSLLDGYSFPNVLVKGIVAFKH